MVVLLGIASGPRTFRVLCIMPKGNQDFTIIDIRISFDLIPSLLSLYSTRKQNYSHWVGLRYFAPISPQPFSVFSPGLLKDQSRPFH